MVEKADSGPENTQNESYSFLKKVLIFIAVAAAITLLVLFIGYAIDIILLIFVGILIGIIFRSLRDYISRRTGIPDGPSLAIVVLMLISLFGTAGYLLAPDLVQQAEMMYNQIPEEWENIKRELWQYSWGKEIAQENPEPTDLLKNNMENTGEDTGDDNNMTRGVLNLFSITVGAIASAVLVFVIGIYIAAEPQVYTNGFLRLFPVDKRSAVSDILDETALAIQWWLVGQIVSMLILGVFTTLGLWLMGMPYALILGIFTALMTFIPNLGPVLAGIPTLLVALTVSPAMAAYVALFYILIQSIEGYLITPLIHREMINVPPVLIITFQFLLYFLIGIIGVFVAMPLVACLMIIVQRVYVEQILGDSMEKDVDIDYHGKTIF